MCGLCKLNAAALDTTVACGYNGIDQHNLGLLPPLRGLIFAMLNKEFFQCLLPPLRGLIPCCYVQIENIILLPPIAGIDTPCRERSAAQRRRPFNTLPSTFHTPSLRSPPHFPFRLGGFCDSKTITKNIFDLAVAHPPEKMIQYT